MTVRLFRLLFRGILLATLFTWFYLGIVSASSREAILIEDRYYGISPEVVKPGEVTFVFTRFVPEKVTLHRVQLAPRALPYELKQGLLQSEALGLDDSFYIKAKLHLEYELQSERSEQLISLFRRLDQPNWKRLTSYLETRLDWLLKSKLREFYSQEGELPGLREKLQAYLIEEALDDINRRFSPEGIRFYNLIPKHVFVPDAERYRSILASGNRILSQKIERIRIIDAAKARRSASEIKDQSYFARLERIGNLLKQYPHLQNYLALEQINERVNVMVIPPEYWFRQLAELEGEKREETAPDSNQFSPQFSPFSSGQQSQ